MSLHDICLIRSAQATCNTALPMYTEGISGACRNNVHSPQGSLKIFVHVVQGEGEVMLPISTYQILLEAQDCVVGTEASITLGTGGGKKHKSHSFIVTIFCPI